MIHLQSNLLPYPLNTRQFTRPYPFDSLWKLKAAAMRKSKEEKLDQGYVPLDVLESLSQAKLYRRGAYDTTGVKKPGAPPPPPK